MAGGALGALEVSVTANLSRFHSAMEKAARDSDRASKRITRNFRRMRNLGNTITRNLALPVGLVGVGMIKSAADFEKGMKKVESILSSSSQNLSKDMAMLEEQAKQLGISTQFSASEAGEAMGFLAMSGSNALEIFEAMPATLNLAAAANLELGRTADIVTNTLKGFGIPVSQLSNATDILVEGFTSANMNLEMLGDAMTYAAPVAKEFGMSFESAVATIGLLGNAGIQASMAGTTLRGMLVQLEKNADDLGITFWKSSGQMRSLPEIMREIEAKGVDVGAIMENVGLRAGPGLLALLGQGDNALENLTKRLEDVAGTGRAAEVAQIQMEGAAGAMKRFTSAMEGLAIAVGESGLLDAFTEIVDQVAEWVRAVASADKETMKFWLTIGAAVAVVGPVLAGLGMIAGGISTLVALFSVSAGAIATAVGGIVAFLGPVGILVVAVSATVYAVINYWDELVAGYMWLNDKTYEFFVEKIPNAIQSGIEKAKEYIKGFSESIKTWMTDKIDALIDPVTGAFERITESGMQMYKDAFGSSWGKDFILDMQAWFGKAPAAAEPVLDQAENISGAFEGMRGTIATVFSDVINGTENFAGAIERILGGLADRIGDGAREFAGSVGDIADDITDDVVEAYEGMKGTLSDIFSDVIKGTENFAGATGRLFQGIADSISDRFEGDIAESIRSIGDVFADVIDGTRSFADAIDDILSDLANRIIDRFSGDIADSIVDAITGGGGGGGGIGGIIGGLIDSIGGLFGGGGKGSTSSGFGGTAGLVATSAGASAAASAAVTKLIVSNAAKEGAKIAVTSVGGQAISGSAATAYGLAPQAAIPTGTALTAGGNAYTSGLAANMPGGIPLGPVPNVGTGITSSGTLAGAQSLNLSFGSIAPPIAAFAGLIAAGNMIMDLMPGTRTPDEVTRDLLGRGNNIGLGLSGFSGLAAFSPDQVDTGFTQYAEGAGAMVRNTGSGTQVWTPRGAEGELVATGGQNVQDLIEGYKELIAMMPMYEAAATEAFSSVNLTVDQTRNILADGIVTTTEQAALGMARFGDMTHQQFGRVSEAVNQGIIRMEALRGEVKFNATELQVLTTIGVGGLQRVAEMTGLSEREFERLLRTVDETARNFREAGKEGANGMQILENAANSARTSVQELGGAIGNLPRMPGGYDRGGGLPRFATGGSFTVGGKAGVDKNLVAFWASRGEKVDITPASGVGTGFSMGAQTLDEKREREMQEALVNEMRGLRTDISSLVRFGGL